MKRFSTSFSFHLMFISETDSKVQQIVELREVADLINSSTTTYLIIIKSNKYG